MASLIFEGFMSFMGIAGMVGGVAFGGINAAKEIPEIEDNARKISANADQLQAKINKIVADEAEIDAELNQEMQQLLLACQGLHAEINTRRDSALKQLKSIQIGGIVFIVVIFFILIMKRYGISQSINNILMAPFQKNKK